MKYYVSWNRIGGLEMMEPTALGWISRNILQESADVLDLGGL